MHTHMRVPTYKAHAHACKRMYTHITVMYQRVGFSLGSYKTWTGLWSGFWIGLWNACKLSFKLVEML